MYNGHRNHEAYEGRGKGRKGVLAIIVVFMSKSRWLIIATRAAGRPRRKGTRDSATTLQSLSPFAGTTRPSSGLLIQHSGRRRAKLRHRWFNVALRPQKPYNYGWVFFLGGAQDGRLHFHTAEPRFHSASAHRSSAGVFESSTGDTDDDDVGLNVLSCPS